MSKQPFQFFEESTYVSPKTSSSSSIVKLIPSITSIIAMVMISILSTVTALVFFSKVRPASISPELMDNLYSSNNNYDKLLNSEDHFSHDLKYLTNSFYNSDGITHDVFIKQLHSHNDYWRENPLFDALSLGVQSVEADIWYFPEVGDTNIYVGHSLRSLNANKTLESLYLDPIFAILEGSNLNSNLTNDLDDELKKVELIPNVLGGGVENGSARPSGVWNTDLHQTLYLFIDFKTIGEELFDPVMRKFDKFRENDWLSWYNVTNNEFNWGPLTVIGTGNIPLNMVIDNMIDKDRRDIFFDGPLEDLNDEDQKFNIGISPIVSCSLKKLIGGNTGINGMNDEQLEITKRQISYAHSIGVKTRIWDTPWWPISTKFKIWRQLLDSGIDFLNVDDLKTASSFV